MPGLYGITSNANISVYNTVGLYNVGNTNVAVKGNVTVSNTLGLYQGLGNPIILTNAQQLYTLLDESGNVQFALTNSNTTVKAFTANINTPTGTYGSGLTVPVITTSADGRVTNISQTLITGYVGQYSNANVAAYLPVNSANVAAPFFLGNGAFLSGLPASSVTLTGDVTGAGNTGTPFATALSATGVVGGTYGSDVFVPQITVDSKGRVTTIANVIVSPGGYGNSNVAAFLPTYGGTINTTSAFSNAGIALQGTTWSQLQWTNGGAVPADQTNIGTGAWFYLDNNGAVFESNATGTLQSVTMSPNGNLTVSNSVITTYGVFWANGDVYGGSTYSNSNVAAYLASGTDTTINAINANITAANATANSQIASTNANVTAVNVAISNLQANVYSNANVTAYLPINSANVAGEFFLGNAFFMTGVGAITYSNANVQAFLPEYTGTLGNSSTIIAINANVAAANVNIASTASNVSVLQTNAATQATQINSINANVTAANTNITSLQTNVSVLQSNIGNFFVVQNLADVGTNLPRYETTGSGYIQYYITATTSNTMLLSSNVTGLASSMNYMLTTTGGRVGANILSRTGNLVGLSDAYDFLIGVNQSIYPGFAQGDFYQGNPIYQGLYADANVVITASNAAYQTSQITTIDANIGAFQTYANSTFGTASNIASTNANVTAANSAISTLQTNAATQATAINSTNANVTAANSAITVLQSNVVNITSNLGSSTASGNIGVVGSNRPVSISGNTWTIDATGNSTVLTTLSVNNLTTVNGYPINGNVTSIAANTPTVGTYRLTFTVSNVVYPWTNSSIFPNSSIYANVQLGNLFVSNAAAQSLQMANFQTYANATFGTSSFGNANVAAYLPTYTGTLDNSSTIVAINANVTAANSAISTLQTNAATQATQINSTNANVTAANSSIQTLSANVGAYQTYANANAATQQTQIDSINANVSAANASIQTISANLGAFQTYANSTFGSSSFGNANVAAYLPTDSLIISIENAAINSDSYSQRDLIQTYDAEIPVSTNVVTINGGIYPSYVRYVATSNIGNVSLAPYLYSVTNLTAANGGIVSGLVTTEPYLNIGGSWQFDLIVNRGTYPWFTGVSPYNFSNPGNFSNVVVNAAVPSYLTTSDAIKANIGAFQTYANITFYQSGNVITAANVSSTNGYFWSNGVAYSTGGGSSSSISNGASNVSIATSGGNISMFANTGIIDARSTTGAFILPTGANTARPSSPVDGMIRFNSNLGNPEWYSNANSAWYTFNSNIAPPSPPVSTYTMTYLVVAGGGGGGGGQTSGGGGGGAGGLIVSNASVTTSTVYTITVGAGGAGVAYTPSTGGGTGGNGGNSSITGSGFSSVIAIGGGGGGGNNGPGPTAAASGGSGGGVPNYNGSGTSPGSGTSGQGNAGGNAGAGSPNYPSGGGGGAGAAGSAPASQADGGNGGNGLASTITGASVTYAGGGGGAYYNVGAGAVGTGGTGGGGAGGNGTGGTGSIAGSTNTGGGGGGDNQNSSSSSAGGSGVVILSVPTASYSGTYTGTVSVSTTGSNTILTFTASGTYTA